MESLSGLADGNNETPKGFNKDSSIQTLTLDNHVKRTMDLIKQKQQDKAANLIQNKTKFAGEEFVYEKEMNEKEKKALEQKERNKTHKELDDLVENITKKREINVFDKTKVDWKNYVDKNNLSRELDYARKDGYLSKKRFIEEANYNLIQHKKEEEKKSKYSSSLQNKKLFN